MYKHVYGHYTKDEHKKSQYQDTICKEGHGDRPWEVRYDNVVDPSTSQPSEETSGAFLPTE